MANALATLLPATGDLKLLMIYPGKQAYSGDFVIRNITDRFFTLFNKKPGGLCFHIATARGMLDFSDLSNPVQIFIEESGEICDGYLYYELDTLLVILQ